MAIVFLSDFFYSIFGRTGKSYFQIFVQLLLQARVTRIRVINMICRVLSKSCPLLINRNGGLKQEHL